MSRPRQSHGVALVAAAVFLPLGAGAAEKAPPPAKVTVPADFLEYLAALEGADDDWTDFEGVAAEPAGNSRKVAPKAAKAVEAK